MKKAYYEMNYEERYVYYEESQIYIKSRQNTFLELLAKYKDPELAAKKADLNMLAIRTWDDGDLFGFKQRYGEVLSKMNQESVKSLEDRNNKWMKDYLNSASKRLAERSSSQASLIEEGYSIKYREDAVTTKADPNKIDSNFILDELGGIKIITFKYQSPETGKVIDVSMVADPNTTRAQAHKLIAKYHKAMKQVRRNNNGIDPLWEGKKKKVKRNYQKEIGRKNRRGTNYQSILPSGKKKPVKALKLKSLMQKADEKRAERKGG
jgi:hypothetical protein